MTDRTGAKLPTLVLILLAPLIAELSWGSLPIQVAYALPFLIPVYGCGALLVRELVRRAGRGWASVLLLGVAYEIMEDGFGLRAMFSPYTYHAAQWGARMLGVNWAYVELNAVYHAAFSIAVPILVTDLIFPARRHRPYLRLRGLIIAGGGYLLGVALLRVAVAPQAPGANASYPAPLGHLVAAAAVVIVLGVVALRVLPRGAHRVPVCSAPPTPRALAAVAAVGTVVALRLPTPLGAGSADPRPVFGPGLPVLAQLAASLAVVVVVLVLLSRWAARDGWTDRHLVGIAGGALVGHTAVGISLFAIHNPAELVTLAALALLEVTLVVVLHRRVRDATPAGTDGALRGPQAPAVRTSST